VELVQSFIICTVERYNIVCCPLVEKCIYLMKLMMMYRVWHCCTGRVTEVMNRWLDVCLIVVRTLTFGYEFFSLQCVPL